MNGAAVVAAIDGSEHSRAVVAFAMEEARCRRAPLQVVICQPVYAETHAFGSGPSVHGMDPVNLELAHGRAEHVVDQVRLNLAALRGRGDGLVVRDGQQHPGQHEHDGTGQPATEPLAAGRLAALRAAAGRLGVPRIQRIAEHLGDEVRGEPAFGAGASGVAAGCRIRRSGRCSGAAQHAHPTAARRVRTNRTRLVAWMT